MSTAVTEIGFNFFPLRPDAERFTCSAVATIGIQELTLFCSCYPDIFCELVRMMTGRAIQVALLANHNLIGHRRAL